LFAERDRPLAGRIFRGYVAHSLLFYRQHHLGGLAELARIGNGLKLEGRSTPERRESPVGPGWKLAQRAMALSDEKMVLRLLNAAVKEAPNEPAFLVLRGFAQGENRWGSRRLSRASIADFEAALALNPNLLWARMGLGMAHEMHRRFVRAKAEFDAAAALAPTWPWPRIFAGVCLWYLAEFRMAIDCFEEAGRLDPQSEFPLIFAARAKADIRDASLADDLDRALQLAPDSGFAASWRGRAMFVLRRTPEALEDLRRSIKQLPGYDRGWSWLGVSLMEQGQHAQAVKLLSKARVLNPYYPTTLYPLAGALMRVGQWTRAGRILREAAAVDRSGVWVEHRISMSHPNPACLRSRADLDAFLGARPRSGWAWAWRGQTELLLQNYWRAIEDLDRAQRVGPPDPWIHVWRGEAWRRLGVYDRALPEFAAALRAEPSLSWGQAGVADCLFHAGRSAAALRAIDRSLALEPHCAPAHSLRGLILLSLKRPGAAAAALVAALELHPQDRWVARRLAAALALSGDWTGALDAYRLAGPSDDDAAFEGVLLWRAGRTAEAQLAFSRAGAGGSWKAVRSKSFSLKRFLISRARRPPGEELAPAAMARRAKALGLTACAAAVVRGDWSKALEGAQVAPSTPQAPYRILLGWLRLRCNDPKGALEEAARALDATLNPDDGIALRIREDAQAALNSAGRRKRR
jgi:tetratricopeptide (TPR) repeat protein